MRTYTAPLRDMSFVIDEWLGAPSDWASMPKFSELDAGTAAQVLEEAARFARGRLAPLNASGDLEGARFSDGAVRMPEGFAAAYRDYAAGGWPGLAAEPEEGGQGLPQLLNVAWIEMLAAANHAWLMSPGLSHGAAECLREHGSPWLKAQYLDKLVSGECLSSMCLTEAQAGSDLGLIAAKAVPADTRQEAEPAYRITGTKIFITGGDHDLTPNIVHLVLARLPDAPAGSRGLSLFLVPKRRESAAQPEMNAVTCQGIEKKMGPKASPTCTMQFDGALGWMVGQPHRGLQAMFVMMNAARLQVAMQGLGHAESATQCAIAYAADRRQSRAVGSAAHAGQPSRADAIILLPAIRRALLDLHCVAEGARMVGYWLAHCLDLAAAAPESGRREEAALLASLLTPVAKASFTEAGFQSASKAMQVLGGYGYMHEFGVEQTLRDSRVSMIYEGTNEVQAVDFVVRKTIADSGKGLNRLLDVVRKEAEAATCDETRRVAQQLLRLCDQTAAAAAALIAESEPDPELSYRVAGDFLAMVDILLHTFAWARAFRIARPLADSPFYARKCETARYFFAYRLGDFDYRRSLVERGRANVLPHVNPA
ncbi:acyl-CoA dehydrogenase family protein [Cupriavidus numazuensis]|uniref:3-methylmercaptopropionyl-CoA dehydrogenase n=1 Tax=Cupriavidus numazuensis TaxID=221992 RepID=A0ABM8TRX6_9BURK|nr:acyl-CoA dehydrogenase family protein [Cupriavidus numazuensis]CAG2159025.1 3-methylmercaptopropionyl-CoA dehydrogenase [Cupriavidus numazuensis]